MPDDCKSEEDDCDSEEGVSDDCDSEQVGSVAKLTLRLVAGERMVSPSHAIVFVLGFGVCLAPRLRRTDTVCCDNDAEFSECGKYPATEPGRDKAGES